MGLGGDTSRIMIPRKKFFVRYSGFQVYYPYSGSYKASMSSYSCVYRLVNGLRRGIQRLNTFIVAKSSSHTPPGTWCKVS